MAAYSFIIDDSTQLGAIPGDDGWRCVLRPDGTEERTRYFAVTFGKMFYKRFVQASIENDYDALPGIFHAAMVRIGDVMVQGLRHADTACRLVCEEQHAVWYVAKIAPSPSSRPASGRITKPGEVEQRAGRCYVFDSKGHCPKGNVCAFRGAHNNPPPKRTRDPVYQSDDDRRGSPPRRQQRRA